MAQDNDPESLDIEARRERIAKMVDTEQFASVKQLANLFGVSQVTIRTDIDALSKEHHGLRRVRGGILRGQVPYSETPYEARSSSEEAGKRAIGEAAADIVQSNDTVILDVGTTTMAIAEALVKKTDLTNVTVFTNGINIALVLERAYPRIMTVVTGGSLRPLQHSLVEPMATLILGNITANIAFLGCNGIDPEFGISATNLPEASIKQVIVQAAHQVFVVADASKFGRRTLAHVCGLEDVDCFLTAGFVDDALATQIREAGATIRNALPAPRAQDAKGR